MYPPNRAVTPVRQAHPSMPEPSDEWWTHARSAAAHFLLRAAVAAGLRPTPAEARYFRDALREEEAFEARVQNRLDSLACHPVPVPVVRVTAKRGPVDRMPIRSRRYR